MTEKTNIVLITSPRSGSTWFLDQIEKEKEELIKMEKEHTKLNCPECNKNILLDFESMELLTI